MTTTLTDQELDTRISGRLEQLKSWVTVGADKDAKLLERIAAKETLPPSSWDKLELLFKTYASLKAPITKTAEPSLPEAPKDEKPQEIKPAPPVQRTEKPQAEVDKSMADLEKVVSDVAGKVKKDMQIEKDIVDKVRDALKKLQPQQPATPALSDEDILSAVRSELSTEIKAGFPVGSEIHKAVNRALEELERVDTPSSFHVEGEYWVMPVGKVNGNEVVQLMADYQKLCTGLFCLAAHKTFNEAEAREYYKNQFSLTAKGTQKTELDSQSDQSKEIKMQGQLTIRYVPAEKLENCMFIARKGNLVAKQTATALITEETQKAILASEQTKTAAGKVQYGVGDYDVTKGKTDTKLEMGKEKTQPGDLTKNLGGVEKLPAEYSATKPNTSDTVLSDGKEPIQPSQVVSKYASLIGGKIAGKVTEDPTTGVVEAVVEGGSIARLSQLWKTKPEIVKPAAKVAGKKEAMITGEPGGWARETTEPVSQDPRDLSKATLARETPDPVAGAKPTGAAGGEQIKYFGQLDKARLTETGDGWARKVASLETKLAAAEAKVTPLEAENRLLKASLEKAKKAQEDDKRGTLVEAIMERMIAAEALNADQQEVLELKDKGLEHDDAVLKATANARDRQRRKLASLDLAALEQMREVITRYGTKARTAETEELKPVDLPIVGNPDLSGDLPEDKLAASW